MDDVSLNEFLLGVTELEKYISYNEACNKVISSEKTLGVKSSTALSELIDITDSFYRKRVFEYNSYIITLYGLFERFLEDILSEYLEALLLNYQKYNELPLKIKNTHLKSTVAVLKNLDNPKFRSLTEEKLVFNLNEAINNNKTILNIDGFTNHSYNFKQKIIAEYLSDAGLENISASLKKFSPLREWLDEKYQEPGEVHYEVAFQIVNDLAQRRNDVAHGVANIELLNVSFIKEYIEYLKLYCETMFNIVDSTLLGLYYGTLKSNFTLISVIDGQIVCGTVNNITISVGDRVLIKRAKTNSPRYITASIEAIQVEETPKEKIVVSNSTNIGLKLNKRVKDNCQFIIAP